MIIIPFLYFPAQTISAGDTETSEADLYKVIMEYTAYV